MFSFIAELKKRLPEADWPIVSSSLRLQPKIWKLLQDEPFGTLALDAAGHEHSKWNPAAIAFLAINKGEQFQSGHLSTNKPLPDKLRFAALSLFEELEAAPERYFVGSTLEDAFFFALAINERYLLSQSHSALQKDLSILPEKTLPLTMAYLFAIFSDLKALLSFLITEIDEQSLQEIMIQAFFSQPLAEEEQIRILDSISHSISDSRWIALLQLLSTYRAKMAGKLAASALERFARAQSSASGYKQLEQLKLESDALLLSGDNKKALALLSQAWDSSQRLQAELAAQLAKSAENSDDRVIALAALEQAAQLNPGNKSIDNKLLAGKISNGKISHTAINAKSGNQPQPLLSAAKVASKEGNIVEAREMLSSAWMSIKRSEQRSKLASIPNFANDLVEQMLALDMTVNAHEVAEYAFSMRPNSASAADVLSKTQFASQESEAALQSAHLAVALAPTELPYRKNLATILQSLGHFAEALAEWDYVLGKDEALSEEEQLSIAQCAFGSANFQECDEILSSMLAQFPDSAPGHLLQGKLLIRTDHSAAAEEFEKAIQLDPSLEEAWLSLSKSQQEQGEIKTAIDTLLEAKGLFTQSARLLVQLASLFQLGNNASKAIELLAEAKKYLELNKDAELSQNAFLLLGTLEIEEGEVENALKTFEEAHLRFPSNQRIAKSFGRHLLLSGYVEKAISPLKIAIKSNAEDSELSLDLAKAFISSGKELIQAEEILHALLNKDPEHKLGRILHAECQLAQGKSELSAANFAKLAKSSIAEDAGLHKRIQIGQANAQLEASNFSEALTILEALNQSSPNDLEVMQTLCGAYSQAGKGHEAFQIANHLYLTAPRTDESILWFAMQANNTGHVSEAISALEEAINNNPASQDLKIRLAKLFWQTDQKSKASASFEAILDDSNFGKEHLLDIAEFLSAQEDNKLAARFISKAIDLTDESDPELFEKLAECLTGLGKTKKSLQAIEKAILLSPQNPKYLIKKVNLLKIENRPQAALESLDQAIALMPEDAALLDSKAQLLNQIGDKSRALTTAEKALQVNGEANIEQVRFAVKLAIESLNFKRARKIIANVKKPSIDLICSDAEAAFALGLDIEAAQAIASIAETDFDTPRVQALLAILELSKGDIHAAEESYKRALRQIGKSVQSKEKFNIDPATLLSVSSSGDLLMDWESSIRILEKLMADFPDVASYQFALANALINQHEWQQICEASQIVNHRPQTEPDDTALLERLSKLLINVSTLAQETEAQEIIAHLLVRAQLRLAPSALNEALPENYPQDEEQAAALEYAASKNELLNEDSKRIRRFANSDRVLIEMAIRHLSSDPTSAFAFAKQAVKSAPNKPAYQAIEAQTAATSGNLSQAISSIEHALAFWPNEARWHTLLADWLIESGDAVAALPHLEMAVQLEDSNSEHHFKLGLLQHESRNHNAAAASFEMAGQLNPNRAEYAIYLAGCYLDMGELNSAKAITKRVFKLTGRNAEYLLLLSKLESGFNQDDKAIALIQEAAKLSPNHTDYYAHWADLMVKKGAFDNALALMKKAAKTANDPIPWLIKSAKIKANIDELSNEANHLVELQKEYPDSPQIASALAQAQARDGDLETAQKTAEKALQYAKSLPIIEQAELHQLFASMYKSKGQLDKALSELEKSAGLAEHIVDTHLEMGHVFLARRQRHSALQAFEKASQVDPASPEPHLQLAQLFKNSKDYEKAEGALRRAAKVAPANLSIQRQLAAVMALNLVHQPKTLGVSS